MAYIFTPLLFNSCSHDDDDDDDDGGGDDDYDDDDCIGIENVGQTGHLQSLYGVRVEQTWTTYRAMQDCRLVSYSVPLLQKWLPPRVRWICCTIAHFLVLLTWQYQDLGGPIRMQA